MDSGAWLGRCVLGFHRLPLIEPFLHEVVQHVSTLLLLGQHGGHMHDVVAFHICVVQIPAVLIDHLVGDLELAHQDHTLQWGQPLPVFKVEKGRKPAHE